MGISRRAFLSTSSLAAAGIVSGRVFGAAAEPKNEQAFAWGSLIHLGRNLWAESDAADHLRFDEELWRKLSADYRACGVNMILLDLAEGLVYPSHPELAVRGSWPADKLRDEIRRLRGMGFEVIPKVNLSTAHDTWLGPYERMVSTQKYYEVVNDILRDVSEIFDRPRLFHLGWDEEEKEYFQKTYQITIMRQGDLWWNDLFRFADTVADLGSRPWIWSDKVWYDRDEFYRKMPKSILQSPWFYGHKNTPVDPKATKDVVCYAELAQAGFDVLPCGGNCYNNNDNFRQTAEYCRKNLPNERVKGFLFATWCELTKKADKDKHGRTVADRHFASSGQIAEAIKAWNS